MQKFFFVHLGLNTVQFDGVLLMVSEWVSELAILYQGGERPFLSSVSSLFLFVTVPLLTICFCFFSGSGLLLLPAADC